MRQAATGDTVLIHYRGTFADGTEFDKSLDDEPIDVVIGDGDMIAGFENALVGMTAGSKKKITLASEDAYGPYDPRIIHTIKRADVPPDVDLELGGMLSGNDKGGKELRLTIIELTDSEVRLDANHPLAGKDLTFDLELIEFVEE